MAGSICDCENIKFGNTGEPGCVPLQEVPVAMWFVPRYDSAGLERKFVASDFDTANLLLLLNAADPSDRIYPVVNVENITGERADAVLETFDSGRTNYVKDGARNFLFIADRAGAPMVGNLEHWRCQQFGIIAVGVNGSLIGRDLKDGFLRPLPVDNGSLAIKLNLPTHTTVQKVAVSFNFAQELRDSEFGQIIATSFTGNALAARGLFNMYSTISNISTIGFDIELNTEYGDPDNRIGDKGRVTADFVSSDTLATGQIYNETDDADIAVTVTTLTPANKYHVAFAAQTLSDVLVPFLKFNGRDYSPLLTNKVTIV